MSGGTQAFANYCQSMANGGTSKFNNWHRGACTFGAVLLFAACGGGSESASRSEAPSSSLAPDEQALQDGKFARCNEGGYSDNTDFSATCSSAGDVAEWLADFGRCNDGRIIAMNEDASCNGNEGFDTVMPAGFLPVARATDVALCTNGTYSDNTDFHATCSSAGGVDQWLTQYGRCDDGAVIQMSADARCNGDFDELIADDVELVASSSDLARCTNGTYSDNTDLRAICSANGGVAEWLAEYVECADGSIVELNADTSCNIAALRPGYTPPPATTTTTTMATTPPTTAAAPTTVAPIPSQPAPGSDLTPSQQNAVRSARSYLDFSGFSRQGLIDQLSSEFGDQYTTEQATYGADNVGADWNANALRSARSYLDFQGFSCQGLIDQLSSEFGDQYTAEQATYGATEAGIC